MWNLTKLAVYISTGLWIGAAYGEHAVGTATDGVKSLENAYVSAHFRCNRKGLWADLDSLKVVGRDTTRRTYSGGTKKITFYNTHVDFDCTPDYQKNPSETTVQ